MLVYVAGKFFFFSLSSRVNAGRLLIGFLRCPSGVHRCLVGGSDSGRFYGVPEAMLYHFFAEQDFNGKSNEDDC